jgi:hypothetical protein
MGSPHSLSTMGGPRCCGPFARHSTAQALSLVRDSWHVENVEIRSHEDVVSLVNRLNREGVAVYRRLSPPILCSLMAFACQKSAEFHETLDPFAVAAFNVSWAGEDQCVNWFDTARELTERWHHQQQIRLATSASARLLRSRLALCLPKRGRTQGRHGSSRNTTGMWRPMATARDGLRLDTGVAEQRNLHRARGRASRNCLAHFHKGDLSRLRPRAGPNRGQPRTRSGYPDVRISHDELEEIPLQGR